MMDKRYNCSSFREFEYHSFSTDNLKTSGRVLIVELLRLQEDFKNLSNIDLKYVESEKF